MKSRFMRTLLCAVLIMLFSVSGLPFCMAAGDGDALVSKAVSQIDYTEEIDGTTKYGAAYGNRQEEESPALLDVFLRDFDLPSARKDRIIYLVSHHHTTTEVDGLDYRILLEADFLVNASEARMDRSAIQTFYDQVAKTDTARRLFRSIYLS